MEMKNILSLSGRLQRLLAKAEEEAEGIIKEAQDKADETVRVAKEEAEKRLIRAQYRTGLDEFLKDAEDEARKEAKRIEKEYAAKAKEIKAVPRGKIVEAAELLFKEVLPQ